MNDALESNHADVAVRADELRRSGRPAEAECLLRSAAPGALRSEHSRVLLGVVVAMQGRFDEALDVLAEAANSYPESSFAHMNLANVFRRKTDDASALLHYRRAVEIDPALTIAWSNMLRPLMDAFDWPAALKGLSVVMQGSEVRGARWEHYLQPMDSLLLPVPEAICRAVADVHALQIARSIERMPVLCGSAAGPLRIGYLSRDFRDHAVGHLMRGPFALHDRARVEVFAYSSGRDDASLWRRHLERDADHFADVSTLADAVIANQIRQDRIQILIDLGGHTKDHRLGVLAYRPAPVQVHYLGYPGTLGGSLADYFITDPIASPAGQDTCFSEHLVRLPLPFMASDAEASEIGVGSSREFYGLPRDGVVFCAFHQIAKVTPRVFQAWIAILRDVPESVLWLRRFGDEAAQNMATQALANGVTPDRLVFAPPVADRREHLGRMRIADVFLDTFERYNGHSTVMDALRCGVPVVTCSGTLFASRVAASLSIGAGISDLVCEDDDGYVACAVRLGTSPPLRAAIQRRLDSIGLRAPTFDAGRQVRHLEAAYAAMWALHVAGDAPRELSF